MEAVGGGGFFGGEEGEPGLDEGTFWGSGGERGSAIFADGGADAEGGYAALRTEGYENGFVGRFGATGAGGWKPGKDEVALAVFLYRGAFGRGKGACGNGDVGIGKTGVWIVAFDGSGHDGCGGAVVAGAFGFCGGKGAAEEAGAGEGFGKCVGELDLLPLGSAGGCDLAVGAAVGNAEDGFAVADVAGDGTDPALECAEDAVGCACHAFIVGSWW